MGEWEDVGKMLTMLAGDWNKGGREARGKRQEKQKASKSTSLASLHQPDEYVSICIN